MKEKLLTVFEAEAREDWSSAYAQYRSLWTQNATPEVAAHWGFLCWYLLHLWEDGKLAAMPKGISKVGLFAKVDAMAEALLTFPDPVPEVYLALLVYMKQTRPYFIQEPVFSQGEARDLQAKLGAVPLSGQFPQGSLLHGYFSR